MPRIARVVAVDYPHHITQRGNNRGKVFFAAQTRKSYLELLQEHARKYEVGILAYCLMTNHVHLLVRPHHEGTLAKMMHGLNFKYTQYINTRYERTGRLWEGRYYSCVVDEENYLWSVTRYLEENPCRAKMVSKAEEYLYSSARRHILGEPDDVLTEELFPEEKRNSYTRFIEESVSESEINQIRHATSRGKPLGQDSFVNKIGNLLKRDFIIKASGRPSK
jgi:putative transposase